MTHRPRTVATLLLLFALPTAHPAHAAEPSQQQPLNEIYLEVSALSTLYDLDATPDQLKALHSLAADTVSKKPLPPSPHPGKPYRSALTALRDSYVKADDNEIGDCDERLANLEEKMDNPPDPHVDITDAARQKTRDALKLFTPSQLANYISAHTDDAPDPAGTLLDALDTVRNQPDKAFNTTRKQTADDVASLLAGPDSDKRKSLSDQVISLLDKAHSLSDDEFKTQKPDLEKQAHKLADPPDPAAVLTHWLHRDMAELLSNPQLPNALSARMK
jgi:hypothetical protein